MPGCAPLQEGTNQQGICPVGVDGTAESSARILMRVTTANAGQAGTLVTAAMAGMPIAHSV